MTSTASANGSAHSLSAGLSAGGNGTNSGGGMDELLPLVLQLTNAESVSSQRTGIHICVFIWINRLLQI